MMTMMMVVAIVMVVAVEVMVMVIVMILSDILKEKNSLKAQSKSNFTGIFQMADYHFI